MNILAKRLSDDGPTVLPYAFREKRHSTKIGQGPTAFPTKARKNVLRWSSVAQFEIY